MASSSALLPVATTLVLNPPASSSDLMLSTVPDPTRFVLDERALLSRAFLGWLTQHPETDQ